MWLFGKKQNTQQEYSKELVEYLLKDMLAQTVSREILFELIKEELEPIVGKDIIVNFFTKLNEIEKHSDKNQLEYWSKKAKRADDLEIFDD